MPLPFLIPFLPFQEVAQRKPADYQENPHGIRIADYPAHAPGAAQECGAVCKLDDAKESRGACPSQAKPFQQKLLPAA